MSVDTLIAGLNTDETLDLTDQEAVPSFDIGYQGWSPAANQVPVTWSEGLLVLGNPEHNTIVYPNQGSYPDDSCCRVDGAAKHVRFKNIDFQAGTRTGPYLGITSAVQDQPKHLSVIFEDCTFDNFAGTIAKWNIMAYQADIYLIRCRTKEGMTCYEHFIYDHGLGQRGHVILQGCTIDGRFAEIVKVTGRPHHALYVPPNTPKKHAWIDGIWPYGTLSEGHRGLIGVYDSYLTGYAWPGSFHGGGGGAGIVAQGPGGFVDIHTKNTVVKGNHGHAVGIEVLGEWIGQTGKAEIDGPGCGNVVLEDSVFCARKDPDKSTVPPLVRIHGAELAVVNRCGLYGNDTRIAVPENMPNRMVYIGACNTMEHRATAYRLGYGEDAEAVIDATGRPASEGYAVMCVPDIQTLIP